MPNKAGGVFCHGLVRPLAHGLQQRDDILGYAIGLRLGARIQVDDGSLKWAASQLRVRRDFAALQRAREYHEPHFWSETRLDRYGQLLASLL